MARIVCHYSCGAASAVMCKLILAQHPPENVFILNAFVKEEHEDNRRFLKDCEKWFAHPIIVLRDTKYDASAQRVWIQKRFLANGQWGAPCSGALKRDVLEAWCAPSDTHVIGYTTEEQDRVDQWIDANNGKSFLTPLIDANLSHDDCLGMVERAGLVLPLMYRLGYNNANCIGCCKGGEGYWNKIRRDFPATFAQVVTIQEFLGEGSYIFRDRVTGVRYGLRDLPPEKGRHNESLPSCSFFCALAEREIAEAS